MTKLSFLYMFAMSITVSAIGKNPSVAEFLFNSPADFKAGSGDVKAVGVMSSDDRFGNADHAIYLQGGYNSYLSLGTDSLLKPKAGTVSIWFKVDNVSWAGKGYEINPIIITKNSPGDDFYEAYCLAYSIPDSKLTATTCHVNNTDTIQISIRTARPIKFGKWYHAAITYDDHFFSLYLNGALQSKLIKNFETNFLPGDSILAGSTGNAKNPRFLNGSVDDIQLFDRVLSQEEITALSNVPDPNRLHKFLYKAGIILGIIAGVTGIVLIAVARYRREWKKEKEKNAIQRELFEMQAQIKKMQMNPHFIFNAMNAVQQFILAGDNENAHRYLGKFSKLLRKTLESSCEDHISLQNEIDILQKHIEIETLRFREAFSYQLTVGPDLSVTAIKIPQMLIQPIIENAIWHGLLPKSNKGNLAIAFTRVNDTTLSCTVVDDGVGLNYVKPETLIEKKSLAIGFIQQRLAMMNSELGGDFSLKITDRNDGSGNTTGTKAELLIPIFT